MGNGAGREQGLLEQQPRVVVRDRRACARLGCWCRGYAQVGRGWALVVRGERRRHTLATPGNIAAHCGSVVGTLWQLWRAVQLLLVLSAVGGASWAARRGSKTGAQVQVGCCGIGAGWARWSWAAIGLGQSLRRWLATLRTEGHKRVGPRASRGWAGVGAGWQKAAAAVWKEEEEKKKRKEKERRKKRKKRKKRRGTGGWGGTVVEKSDLF